jgi:ATP-dependent RNA helicase DeaD
MMTTKPAGDAPLGFPSLGLSDALVAAVSSLGYEEPTPIQREAIPVLLAGRDLLGQAGTGTGKTAAFALPMLSRLSGDASETRTARGLILVPTRELAMQVAEAVHQYAKGSNLTVVPLYGGAPMDQQIRALRRGAQIIVATPGRALDHLRRKTLDLSALEVLVLDEADEMLDMGFAEDLELIIAETPETRQTALFAATMPPRIVSIAGRHLNNPARVTIAREKRAPGKLPRVRQAAYIVSRSQKVAALGRVLEFEDPHSAIIFCRTRIEVDELTDVLTAHGYGARALHGGMEQRDRDRVMQMFRSEKADILVATDVAARGLDIEHVSHVINYDVPNAPEVYVHRIGRTGRIGREGVAITLADAREQRFLRNIEALTKQKIDVLPLPSVADLRAKKLDVTRASLRERIAAGDLDEGRAMVGSLVQESDLLDIAAAAVSMLHESSDQGTQLQPVKPVPEPTRRSDHRASGRPDHRAAGRPDDRFSKRPNEQPVPRSEPRVDTRPEHKSDDRPDRLPRPFRDSGIRTARTEAVRPTPTPGRATGGPRHRATGEPIAVLSISAGKKLGIRPGDLVGAIAGEAGVESRVLGAIRIADDQSTVEVPDALANRIIAALKATKIRGNKVDVKRAKP